LRQKISESLQAMRSPPVAIEDASARLLAQFKVSVATGEPAFLDLLKSLINARHTAFIDQSHWHDVLSTLRQGWIAGLAAESQRIAEAWLEQARLLLVSYYAREQTQLRQSEIRLAGTVRDIGTRLGKATTTAECMDILSEFMPSLGIDSCWVSVFDSAAGGSQVPEHARLLLDYENRTRNPLPENGLLFRAQDLVPGGLRRGAHPRTLVMHPLAQGADEFGFVIFVQGPEDGGVYDALANLIGNTLKSVWLRMALANRSLELESSLAELRQAQDHLIQREKMAALGELVAGIAHEINTPIGIGVTSISTVSEAGQSLIDALDRRSARDVGSAALDMIDGAEIVQRNLERAGALIESFKLIAVDQSSETHRTFVLASYLSDIVRSLEPRLRPGMHTVTLDCQDGLVLTGDPGVFARVISNLILNSVVHGFENVLNGRILIQCKLDNERVLIDYYDNGCGMADEIRERIFHPFFTTKRGRGGTGLGMHIVFNSVTQGLGGTIQCDSLPGRGTHFTMSLPQQGMG
jgi:signal transduction histidine kinase